MISSPVRVRIQLEALGPNEFPVHNAPSSSGVLLFTPCIRCSPPDVHSPSVLRTWRNVTQCDLFIYFVALGLAPPSRAIHCCLCLTLISFLSLWWMLNTHYTAKFLYSTVSSFKNVKKSPLSTLIWVLLPSPGPGTTVSHICPSSFAPSPPPDVFTTSGVRKSAGYAAKKGRRDRGKILFTGLSSNKGCLTV